MRHEYLGRQVRLSCNKEEEQYSNFNVILGSGAYRAGQAQKGQHPPEIIGTAVTVFPTRGAYGGKLVGQYGYGHIPTPAAYGRF